MRAAAAGCLHSCIITLTGFGYEEKENLRNIISDLGGTYCQDLTDETTHLIAIASGSPKYRVGYNMSFYFLLHSHYRQQRAGVYLL